MKKERNAIWMNPWIPSKYFHRFRIPIRIFIVSICLIATSWVTWYFCVVRPRHNTEPVKVYRSTIPEKKKTEVTAESIHTSVHENVIRDASENHPVGEEIPLSSPTGDPADAATEGSTVPSETVRQVTPKQDTAAEKGKKAEALAKIAELEKRYEAIVGEVNTVDSMLSQILAVENGSELSEPEREALENSLMPLLVKQLNSYSANEQREHFNQLGRMMNSMVSDSAQTDEILDELLETLRKNGFIQKF